MFVSAVLHVIKSFPILVYRFLEVCQLCCVYSETIHEETITNEENFLISEIRFQSRLQIVAANKARPVMKNADKIEPGIYTHLMPFDDNT